MKQTLAILMLCCGVLLGLGANAATNPKLKADIAEARKSGLSKNALNIFLSQADGSRMPMDITKKILNNAIATQKTGAPGDQLLLKASEGVAKSVPSGKIYKTVNKLGEELQAIAKSVPTTLSPQARKKAIMTKFLEAHPPTPAQKK